MQVVPEGITWPITEPYTDFTCLAQSVYDEPWTHIHASASDKVASNPDSWGYPPSNMVPARDDEIVTLLDLQGVLPIHRKSNGAEATCSSLAPRMIHDPPTPPQDLMPYSDQHRSHEKTYSNTTALDELSPPYTLSSNDGSSYQGRFFAAYRSHDHATQDIQESDQRDTIFESDFSLDQPWPFYDGGETVGSYVHESFPVDRPPFAGLSTTIGNVVHRGSQAIPIKKGGRSNVSRRHRRSSDTANEELAFAAHGQLSLEIVEEDGQGNATHCGGLSKRGIRIGPLQKEQAFQVAKTRKEQKVCMKCRENRSQVSTNIQ